MPITNHPAMVAFSLTLESAVFFSSAHRAFGSLVIAGVRQVELSVIKTK